VARSLATAAIGRPQAYACFVYTVYNRENAFTFSQYMPISSETSLLASAVYRCSSWRDQNWHLDEICWNV